MSDFCMPSKLLDTKKCYNSNKNNLPRLLSLVLVGNVLRVLGLRLEWILLSREHRVVHELVHGGGLLVAELVQRLSGVPVCQGGWSLLLIILIGLALHGEQLLIA